MDMSVVPIISELNRRGCSIILGSQLQNHEAGYHEAEDHETVYHDTVLPCHENRPMPMRSEVPGRIREMRSLYEYGRESLESRARNFYKQAVFMEDYEDDVPDISCIDDFQSYYPTYHDLKNDQLRAYFTWRAHVRKGDFRKTSESAAYIYIYELLNNIGGNSPDDCLDKMKAFEHGYLDQGFGSATMRRNLRRRMLEYAVIHNMTPEEVRQAADPEMIKRDEAVTVLKEPDRYSDEEVLAALSFFGVGKIDKSPVITRDHGRGVHLFSEIWRSSYSQIIEGQDVFAGQISEEQDLFTSQAIEGKNLFSSCFGKKTEHRWYPLSNAVCCDSVRPDYHSLVSDNSSYRPWGTAEQKQNSADFGHLDDREVVLNESRRYFIKDGVWHVEAYEKLYFDRARMLGLIRRADEKLRRYLNTGRYLKEDSAGKWADPFIDAVIESDRKARIEAARPKIRIDLSGLDQIRKDAAETRDSLLVYDELNEPAESAEAEEVSSVDLDIPLDDTEIQIVKVLLDGGDPADLLRSCRIMPSIAADQISEKLFDEIGDNVIVCEDGKLEIVEDYTDDVRQLVEGR